MLMPCCGAVTPYVSKTDPFVSAVAGALPTGIASLVPTWIAYGAPQLLGSASVLSIL